MLCHTTHGTMLQETQGQQQSKDIIFSFIFFDKSLTLLSGKKKLVYDVDQSLKMVMQYQLQSLLMLPSLNLI